MSGNSIFSWGSNGSGATGLGITSGLTLTPTQVGTDTNWAQVSSGILHSLAITNNGELYAWGNNSNGRTGLGTTLGSTLTPTRVGSATNWAQVSAGPNFSLAITTTGQLWAWGTNANGITGRGVTSGFTLTPTRVGSASNWAQISAGNSHALAITTNGQLWAWGANGSGQLGRGNTTGPQTTPLRIGIESNWTKVNAGGSHSLALRGSGELWAWGANTNGQLGRGNTVSPQTTPLRIAAGVSNWIQISAGSNFSLVIRANGEMFGCGRNNVGQLGTGNTTADRTSLLPAATNRSDWAFVTCRSSHALAITTTGELYAWGTNSNGRTGLGTDSGNTLSPTQVGTDSNWKQVSAGDQYSLALLEIPVIEAAADISSTTTCQADLTRLQLAQADITSTATLTVIPGDTDPNYIEPGYIDPGYFETIGQIVEADANTESTSTVSATVGVIKQAASQQTAQFQQVATISHIHGADLFALSDAQLAATAQRFRDYQINPESVFDIAVDYTKIVQAQSEADSLFDTFIDNERVRDALSTVEAAFSFDVTISKTLDFSAALTCVFDCVTQSDRIRDYDSGLDVLPFSVFAFAVKRVELVGRPATLTDPSEPLELHSEFQQDTFAVKGTDIILEAFGASEVTTQASVLRSIDVDLDSIVDFEIEASAIRSIEQSIESTTQLLGQANVILSSGPIELELFATNLTVGRSVNLDMKVYRIPSETRTQVITSETRNYPVFQETRIFKIRRRQ